MQGDSAAYHGYWGLDFTRVDPHLGTNADFARLRRVRAPPRMKVYLDVVVNHTADVILLCRRDRATVAPEEVPYRDCKGKPYSAQRYAGGKPFPVPLAPATSRASRSCSPRTGRLKKPAG